MVKTLRPLLKSGTGTGSENEKFFNTNLSDLLEFHKDLKYFKV
jgi:hypothetical protein